MNNELQRIANGLRLLDPEDRAIFRQRVEDLYRNRKDGRRYARKVADAFIETEVGAEGVNENARKHGPWEGPEHYEPPFSTGEVDPS